MGLSLAPASEFTSYGDGVIVVGLDPGGLAAGRGIEVGDVILDVERQHVTRPEEVFRIVDDARGAEKESVLLRLKSDEKTQFTALPTR